MPPLQRLAFNQARRTSAAATVLVVSSSPWQFNLRLRRITRQFSLRKEHSSPKRSITDRRSAHSVKGEANLFTSSQTENFGPETLDMSSSERLGLQPCQNLSYPDLSLSSFASSLRPCPELSNWDRPVEILPSSNSNPLSTGYHISEETMQNAVNAEPNSEGSYWQYAMYRGPEGDKPKIHYCKTKERTEDIAQLFAQESVLGFDIEWKPQAKATGKITDNVALIQIASEDRIALFHIARFPGTEAEHFVAPTFRAIMESPDITKVGVAIKGDCTRLRNHLHIRSRGLFELSHLHNVLKSRSMNLGTVNKRLVGLAQQVQEHLGLPLLKSEVRTSDWKKDLNYAQIQYAASDSYAGLQLYKTMNTKRLTLSPNAPCPSHAELDLELLLFERSVAPGPSDDMSDTLEDTEEGSLFDTDSSVDDGACETSLDSRMESLSLVPEDLSDSPASQDALQDSDSMESESSRLTPALDHPINNENSRLLELANAWMDEYDRTRRAPEQILPVQFWTSNVSTPLNRKFRASPSQLRSYYLWHECNLDVPAIAGLLREPPLSRTTVVGYICAAVCEERLAYDPARIALLDRHGHIYVKEHQRLVANAQKSLMEKPVSIATQDEDKAKK